MRNKGGSGWPLSVPTEREVNAAIAALESQSAILTPAKADYIRKFYRENRYKAHIQRWRLAGAIIKGALCIMGFGVVVYVLTVLWVLSGQVLGDVFGH